MSYKQKYKDSKHPKKGRRKKGDTLDRGNEGTHTPMTPDTITKSQK